LTDLPELSADERDRYRWQLWTPGFGEAGQRRLKAATVFVSRIGGVGGTVAMQLAAAGVGRLVLAHAGDLRLNDMNRQMLMSSECVGEPRIEQAARRLREINPHVALEMIGENVTDANVERLVGESDYVVSAAPLFEERLALNRAAVRRGVPLVDCAMYDLEARLLTVVPGVTPCLACLIESPPAGWKREFPVFGAVSSTIGSLAALEVIKLATGLGEPPAGRLLNCDLGNLSFTSIAVTRRPACPVCGSLSKTTSRNNVRTALKEND
jgi:molybdopterin/thiamine biosynthesis adenylyltransferase